MYSKKVLLITIFVELIIVWTLCYMVYGLVYTNSPLLSSPLFEILPVIFAILPICVLLGIIGFDSSIDSVKRIISIFFLVAFVIVSFSIIQCIDLEQVVRSLMQNS